MHLALHHFSATSPDHNIMRNGIRSNASKEWSGTFEELERKQRKLQRASQRIIARHQAQDGLCEDEVQHDLKQKQKLDDSVNKISAFLATNKEKTGSRNKAVKSNIGEQLTLKPAVKQLQKKLTKLGTPDTFKHAKFRADSGFYSEVNLEFMATTGLDNYITGTAFRSRNPLFQAGKTYHNGRKNGD